MIDCSTPLAASSAAVEHCLSASSRCGVRAAAASRLRDFTARRGARRRTLEQTRKCRLARTRIGIPQLTSIGSPRASPQPSGGRGPLSFSLVQCLAQVYSNPRAIFSRFRLASQSGFEEHPVCRELDDLARPSTTTPAGEYFDRMIGLPRWRSPLRRGRRAPCDRPPRAPIVPGGEVHRDPPGRRALAYNLCRLSPSRRGPSAADRLRPAQQ